MTYLFFPAIACIIIVLGLIFADGNPWRRPETPMLDQLAVLETSRVDADPEPGYADVDVYTEYGGIDAWTNLQTALNSADATGTPDGVALTGARR